MNGCATRFTKTTPTASRLVCAAILISTLAGCAVDGGSESITIAQTRSMLVGQKWSRHLDDKQFFADGTFEAGDNGRNYIVTGTWRLDGDRLSLTEDHETTQHRIIRITDRELELTFGS